MDHETAYRISRDRVLDLRRAGDASRTWRPNRPSADHPSVRRGRPPSVPPAAA